MRRFKLAGITVAVLVTGFIVGLVVALSWTTLRPSSPLTAGLPAEWKAASSLFDARVRSRFPIGTPVWTFANALEAEGFKPTWYEADGEYGAERNEGNFVCNIVARVYWRVGKNGAVAAVRGQYREEGCL